jgi:hypothetical protein
MILLFANSKRLDFGARGMIPMNPYNTCTYLDLVHTSVHYWNLTTHTVRTGIAQHTMLVGRKYKPDGFTMKAAACVYEAMLNRKKSFLPAHVIRKLIKRIPMTDYQRQDAIKHLQGGLGVSYETGLRDLIAEIRAQG